MVKENNVKDMQCADMSVLFPPTPDESRLLVGCRRDDYSASLIARAVEDCDAHVLNLNVTGLKPVREGNDLVVDLRVNHRNTLAISRSLTRYGYDVIQAYGADSDDSTDTLRSNAQSLLHILNL